MKRNSIVDGIRKSFFENGLNAEQAVFAMLMTKAVKDQVNQSDIENLNIGEIARVVHETSMKLSCINFSEGELVLQGNYEIHSVSAGRDDEGEPEVHIHMYEIESGETQELHFAF